MADDLSAAPVLLYDGTCGFCAESVQLVLRNDRAGTLRFAALDSAYGGEVMSRHPEIRDVDSVVYVEPPGKGTAERVFTHSSAALRVAEYLGGWWRLFSLTRLIPRPIRDAVYRLVARHRHRLVAARPQCVIPSGRDRARFLA